MDRITITILNWKKWQPRQDIKHPTWLALSNRLLEDPDFFDFSDAELKAFLYIICQCSQKSSPTRTIAFAHAERICRIKPSVILSTIEKLKEIGCLEVDERGRSESVRDPNVDVRDPYATDRTDRQDKTNTTEAPPAPTAAHLNLDPRTADFVASVKSEVQTAWLDLYKDKPWVEREIKSAVVWCLANPQRAPKSDHARFLTNWLARGWEAHRKTMPTNRASIVRTPPAAGETVKIDGCAKAPSDKAPSTLTIKDVLEMAAKKANLGIRSEGA